MDGKATLRTLIIILVMTLIGFGIGFGGAYIHKRNVEAKQEKIQAELAAQEAKGQEEARVAAEKEAQERAAKEKAEAEEAAEAERAAAEERIAAEEQAALEEAEAEKAAAEKKEQEEAKAKKAAEEKAEKEVADKKKTVCIDAGHGGDGDRNHGVEVDVNGIHVMEKDLNLSIALKLKSYLETDGSVNVVITRTGDYTVGLQERVEIAKKNDADLFVSVHNNSSSTGNPADNGCLVIVTQSHYQPSKAKSADVYGDSEALGKEILNNLNSLGIPLTSDFMANVNGGFLRRPSESGKKYPDGSTSDYYALISGCTNAGIPSVIIEHAFVPNYSDYMKYLSDESKLDALARADANAILNFVKER